VINKLGIKKWRKTVFCKLSYVVFFCLLSPMLYAADNDMEAHLSFEVNKDLGRKFDVSLSEGLRFNNNITNYYRSETAVSFGYTFARKHLKLGVGYAFINKSKDYSYYENRHRTFGQLTFKESFGSFKLSWRAKFQATFQNPNTGDYKRNPKLYFRNRLMAEYKIANSRFSPYAYFEFYTSLNDAECNRIDALRSQIGCDYLLTRRMSLGAYYRVQNDIQVKNRQNIFAVGLTASYDF